MPFLWPKKSCGLQLRVLICFVLLAAIRVANVFVPILYKMLGTDREQYRIKLRKNLVITSYQPGKIWSNFENPSFPYLVRYQSRKTTRSAC